MNGMSDERMAELLQAAIDWIWEHVEPYGIDEYVRALKHIGFTDEEIKKNVDEDY